MCVLWILLTLVFVVRSEGPGASISLSPSEIAYAREEGERLPDISCAAQCEPPCTFVWTKLDNTYFTTSAILSLGLLDRSQTGIYRCTARNIDGESTIDISVVVYLKAQSPTITKMPLQTVYSETSSVTLTCDAEGTPPVTYKWMRNGSQISALPQLLLTNIATDQSGEYVCEVMNSFNGNINRQSRSVNILIERVPNKTLNTRLNIRLVENDLTLTCSGDNNPDYSWLLDGVQVSSLSEVIISSHEQSGQYLCVATLVSNGKSYQENKSISVTVESSQRPAACIYEDGVVLLIISVLLLLVTIGLGIFITRKAGIPCINKKIKHATVDPPVPVTTRQEENGESEYESLDTSAVAGPSVYDVVERQNRNAQENSPAERSEYESLDTSAVAGPSVYDVVERQNKHTKSCKRDQGQSMTNCLLN